MSTAIVELGRQTGTPIVLIGEAERNIRTRRITGRLGAEEALRRLLDGTGLTFRRTRSGDLVIVRAAATRRRGGTTAHLQPERRPAGVEPVSEPIIVTASKTSSPLSDYPGSVSIVELDGQQVTARPGGGTAILVDKLPILATTGLGPGRNKIFARAIADSSFNGQSQSNTAFYLGELRLNYSGPDPDLDLFDVRRVEVLAGPYGTLYGAGALGGVVRIEPNAPDTGSLGAKFSGNVSAVRHGAQGHGVAAMFNLPLMTDRLALRAVGYQRVEPGYIDDNLRLKHDVNRVDVEGARTALRFESEADLSMELGFVAQKIRARDVQYSNDPENPLAQRAPRAQPYASDYLMPSLTLEKRWGDVSLVSATGWSRQRGEAVSDDFLARTHFERHLARLLTHETRMSGQAGGTNFVAGFSVLRETRRENYALSIGDIPVFDARFRGRATDLALFSEVSMPLLDGLSGTLGARASHISYFRNVSFPGPGGASTGAGRRRFDLQPSVSLAWKPDSEHLLFLSYRSGSRGGNLLPVSETPGSLSEISSPDRLETFEAGWRYTHSPSLNLSSTLSYTRWSNIQADFLSAAGTPLPNNLGDAKIWGLEAAASWRPLRGLSLATSLFLNNGPAFSPPATDEGFPDYYLARGNRIPNIATLSARTEVAYETDFAAGTRFRLASALRYYGASVAELRSRHPRHLEIGAEARLTIDRWTGMLTITNLTDVRGNRFGIGNSFTIAEGQITPLQPRTIRLGVEVDF
ncbi:TonB-dependent receptor domain-containing protein [Sphingopyxis sp. LARHCG72]